MPVPKRKRSRARRDKRFANKGMQVKTITECRNCQKPLSTHVACQSCGFYKGVKVMVGTVERAVKRAESRKAKSDAAKAAAPAATPEQPDVAKPASDKK